MGYFQLFNKKLYVLKHAQCALIFKLNVFNSVFLAITDDLLTEENVLYNDNCMFLSQYFYLTIPANWGEEI